MDVAASNKWYCDACDLTVRSEKLYQDHLKTKNHRRRIMKKLSNVGVSVESVTEKMDEMCKIESNPKVNGSAGEKVDHNLNGSVCDVGNAANSKEFIPDDKAGSANGSLPDSAAASVSLNEDSAETCEKFVENDISPNTQRDDLVKTNGEIRGDSIKDEMNSVNVDELETSLVPVNHDSVASTENVTEANVCNSEANEATKNDVTESPGSEIVNVVSPLPHFPQHACKCYACLSHPNVYLYVPPNVNSCSCEQCIQSMYQNPIPYTVGPVYHQNFPAPINSTPMPMQPYPYTPAHYDPAFISQMPYYPTPFYPGTSAVPYFLNATDKNIVAGNQMVPVNPNIISVRELESNICKVDAANVNNSEKTELDGDTRPRTSMAKKPPMTSFVANIPFKYEESERGKEIVEDSKDAVDEIHLASGLAGNSNASKMANPGTADETLLANGIAGLSKTANRCVVEIHPANSSAGISKDVNKVNPVSFVTNDNAGTSKDGRKGAKNPALGKSALIHARVESVEKTYGKSNGAAYGRPRATGGRVVTGEPHPNENDRRGNSRQSSINGRRDRTSRDSSLSHMSSDGDSTGHRYFSTRSFVNSKYHRK